MSGSTEFAPAPAAEPIAARVFPTGTKACSPEDFAGHPAVQDFGGSLETGDMPRGPTETPWLLAALAGIVLGALWSRWKLRAAAPTVVARRRRALRPAAG